jgi:hypothetical protein
VAAVDALHDAFETDVDAKIPGTLYVGDSYVAAYAMASAKTGVYKDVNHMFNTITFAIESDRWNSETTFDFYDYENIGATGFRFPGKFPAKFCKSGGVQVINNTHYSNTPAIITIYGPATYPTFTVGTNIYTVIAEIVEGEQLVINQLTFEVYRVTTAGAIINEFNNRGKDPSVFELFPPGELSVYYSGVFPFSITLVAQRSEPQWA